MPSIVSIVSLSCQGHEELKGLQISVFLTQNKDLCWKANSKIFPCQTLFETLCSDGSVLPITTSGTLTCSHPTTFHQDKCDVDVRDDDHDDIDGDNDEIESGISLAF